MINHEKYQELLSVYADNELNETEKSLVEDHLLTCAACQSAYKEYSKLKPILNQWPDEKLSLDFEAKINKALSEKNIRRETMKPTNNVFRIGVGSSLIVVLFFTLVLSQTYTKRGIQGRLKNASDDIGDQFLAVNTSAKRVASNEDNRLSGNKRAETVMTQRTDAGKIQELAKVNAPAPLSSALQYEPYHRKAKHLVPAEKDSANQSFLGGREGFQNQERSIIYPTLPYPSLDQDFNTEDYSQIVENEFLTVAENPLSTFSIDVDTASYSNIRRFLNNNQMPPEDAVRIEEMINYFTYAYPKPEGKDPFSITTDMAQAPWNKNHELIRVGLQGKTFEGRNVPPSNLVFLIDSSGSMDDPNKMPLLQKSFRMFIQQLRPEDNVAIVVYAGAAGLVLDSTSGADKYKIIQAIDNLYAGGSTAGGAGIQLAYEVARKNFIKGGNNRVILATDGDFNVGVSSDAELVRMIEDKRKEGVFSTVLGFGTGNYKDNKMEQLADKGNGNFYYIDNENEAKKVLVSELGSTLFTIAKDVKIQIEFNPSQVKAYRLIGYENRMLKKEDFNDDTKDAGELGAGHTVTALYEIVPADSNEKFGSVDELKYQKQERVNNSKEVMTVKLRTKDPDKDRSELITKTVNKGDQTELKDDFAFASSVAEFGLLLRNSQFKADSSYDQVINRANSSIGKDTYGYRQEFISLVEKAKQLDQRSTNPGVINFKGEK